MVTVGRIKKVYPSKRRNYAPAGFCIYCKTTHEPLSKEHIVPFGIGGNSLVLKKASCVACARITRGFETFLMREAWWLFRSKIGAPSRKKTRPSSFNVEKYEGGKIVGLKTVSAEHAPIIFALPTLPPAGILVGRRSDEPTHYRTWYLHEGLGKHFGVGESASVPYGPMDFCQLLAKIAHGYVIAELGSGVFSQPIADIILGKSNFRQALRHVGGDMTRIHDYRAPPPREMVLHTIGWRQKHYANLSFLIVDIRLFSYLGAPQYHVVIGHSRKKV